MNYVMPQVSLGIKHSAVNSTQLRDVIAAYPHIPTISAHYVPHHRSTLAFKIHVVAYYNAVVEKLKAERWNGGVKTEAHYRTCKVWHVQPATLADWRLLAKRGLLSLDNAVCVSHRNVYTPRAA